ncbi:hypothetical protein A2U01_0051855, partial [Trifolium medium]|nr:hypothetical protein [Trifolium medium]
MDWLSYHYVILDCARKLAFFPEPGVARYLSANRLMVTVRDGEPEISGGSRYDDWIIIGATRIVMKVDVARQ